MPQAERTFLAASQIRGRALRAFDTETDVATIVLVGVHDDRSPTSSCTLLEQRVEHRPEPGAGRTEPSCCGVAGGCGAREVLSGGAGAPRGRGGRAGRR